MEQNDRREQWLNDMHSTSDEAIVQAAKGLMVLGEYGNPTGIHLLEGGKAALRLWRLADASVLLFHGLRVVQPHTMVWMEILANRATACAQFGLWPCAIDAGEQFLAAVGELPEARKWLPHVHHAIGFSHDRLKQHAVAAQHFRIAAEMYVDADRRAEATADYAYALTFSGQAEEAGRVLSQAPEGKSPYAKFVLSGTTAIVRHHQGRYEESVAAGEQAEALAQDNEDAWAVSLAEVRYWISRAVWNSEILIVRSCGLCKQP